MSKKEKSEILSTCLREAASAKAGEIRNKHEVQNTSIPNEQRFIRF